MKSFLVALAIATTSSGALASDYGLTKHNVYGGLGFVTGGFGLGVDYENMSLKDFGMGGYVRMYQKEDDRTAPGYMILGGFIRPHFNKKAWDFYVSPGFAIIMLDDNSKTASGANKTANDSTTFGPSLAIGLLYDLNGTVAIGFENMRHWIWFDEDWRGIQYAIDEFALKFRASF